MSQTLAKVVPIQPRASQSPVPSLDERFEAMFREYFSYVVHSLRLLGVQERDLDDVAQDVFVTVHRRYADYDPNRPVKAWLFSFAARFASNYRRLVRHRLESDVDADTVLDAVADTRGKEESYRQSQLSFLQHALSSMVEEQRVVLIMHDIHGLTAPEIAEALSLPLNTVYSRVRRARKALKKIAAKGAGR